MKQPKEYTDISDEVTPKFYEDFKKGQVLGYKQEDGTTNHYKIVRLDKRRKIVIVAPQKLYTQDELNKHLEGLK